MKPIQPSQEMLRKLHVITVISNPVRYHSRYHLYENFEKHMRSFGAQLHTVELAFGDRPFEVHPPNPEFPVTRFRTFDELWHKEQMICAAISRLPHDWEKVLWIDADITFTNPHWLTESCQLLEHFHVLQLFGEAIDLGPQNQVMQTHTGFVKAYVEAGFNNPNIKGRKPSEYGYGGVSGSKMHPGFCWGMRREAYESVGGLIDWAIAGAADHHMCLALIGEAQNSFPGNIHSRYAAKIMQWQERALKYIRRDIGFVPGVITHHFHGRKKDRRYQERWSILIDNGFDPDLDLKRDSQGLYVLTDRNHRLRDGLRAYFSQRNEDGTEA